MKQKILVVEDEQALAMVLSDRLRAEGYAVEVARDGMEGLSKATDSPFDLIVLDVMLPCKDGFEVCRQVRAAGVITPILMLTARSQSADKVEGLKIGADDYVAKPFDMAELMARVEALLRRAPGRSPGFGVFNFGPVRVDLPGTEVLREGKPVQLSAREFQLLRYLIERRGTTVSRGEILKEVWGYSAETFTRTVDVHVASLRQKLEPDPRQPQLIATVPGFGYKFVA